MRKNLIIILVAACLVCIGCQTNPPAAQDVVRSITVTSSREHKTFSSPDKMTQVLNTLRQLGQMTLAQQDPDILSTDSFLIILERSDGTTTSYQTRGERYIRRNDGPWMQTAPQALSDLLTLLQQLPDDPAQI